MVGKPVALSEKQRTRFAVKSILDVISKKPGRLDEKLAREMISIVQGSSDVLKKKLDVHQVAMVNRYVYMETWHRTFYSMLWYRGNAHTRL